MKYHSLCDLGSIFLVFFKDSADLTSNPIIGSAKLSFPFSFDFRIHSHLLDWYLRVHEEASSGVDVAVLHKVLRVDALVQRNLGLVVGGGALIAADRPATTTFGLRGGEIKT